MEIKQMFAPKLQVIPDNLSAGDRHLFVVVSYTDHLAAIDELRGEVAALRKRAKIAEREAGSALKTYKGLEKVARVVSDNSDRVCGELNVTRQQRDKLAALLRVVAPHFAAPQGLGHLHAMIDAALAELLAIPENGDS